MKKWIVIMIIIAILSVSAIVYGVYYQVNKLAGNTEGIKISLNVNSRFEYANNVLPIDDYYDESTNILETNGATHDTYDGVPMSNYVENLKIGVSLIPTTRICIRLRILDEWILIRRYSSGDEAVEVLNLSTECPYILGENWVYDRETEYIYYSMPIEKRDNVVVLPDAVIGATGYITKTTAAYADSCKVLIQASFEAVQANRMEAVWGINALPVN